MTIITRRGFVAAAGASLLLPSTEVQGRDIVFENGRADAASRTFFWTQGAAAPLRLTPEQAFALPRVAAVVPQVVSQALVRAVYAVRQGGLIPSNVVIGEVEENDRFDFMLSAEGRVEHTVLVKPSLWRRGVSRRMITVYVTDPDTGQQWIARFFYACNNIAVTRVGAPAWCECIPTDVCWRS